MTNQTVACVTISSRYLLFGSQYLFKKYPNESTGTFYEKKEATEDKLFSVEYKVVYI